MQIQQRFRAQCNRRSCDSKAEVLQVLRGPIPRTGLIEEGHAINRFGEHTLEVAKSHPQRRPRVIVLGRLAAPPSLAITGPHQAGR